MSLLKFCLLVLLCFIQHIPHALVSLMYLVTDKRKFFISWLLIDMSIANDLYGSFRTISSVIGENAELDKKHAKTIAKFIDRLAVLFGGKTQHCYREWKKYSRSLK